MSREVNDRVLSRIGCPVYGRFGPRSFINGLFQGNQALFVVNVEPKRIMGEVSEGMLFDIGYADGITPVLAVPERPVPNGANAG